MFFKKYSNKLTHLKSICKKRYFHKQISNNANNPNLVWKTLIFIFPSVKSNDNSTINLKVNGNYYDKHSRTCRGVQGGNCAQVSKIYGKLKFFGQ